MKKNNSFSRRLAAAVLVNDRAAAHQVAAEAMQEIGQQFMDIINQYSTADLPFCIAAMLVTSSSMNGALPDSGRTWSKALCPPAPLS